MKTDITELAQMKGQKVEGSYYLAECTDCGKMYPSNKLNGGEPLFSGDYGECYCPHCNADDAAIGDCGDTAAIAWNYQQGRIDALVEALEKAQGHANLTEAERQAYLGLISKRDERIAELESSTVKLPVGYTASSGHPFNEAKRTVMIPGGGDWLNRLDVEHVLTAAGIKVEAE